jgi:hypothetical protein
MLDSQRDVVADAGDNWARCVSLRDGITVAVAHPGHSASMLLKLYKQEDS